MGAHDPDTGGLVYVGDIGTGFNQAERAELLARLEPIERATHPFATTPPREDIVRARWVEPVLVGEVVYRQFTRGAGRLRHTAWRGLRADRRTDDVVAPRSEPRPDAKPPSTATPPTTPLPTPGPRITVQAGNRRLTLSNLDKVLYPDGFTKGEVINYYSRIAPVLLPHVARRPVTFVRFPNGVAAEQFFEKNVPNGAPDWLPTVSLATSGSRGHGEIITYAMLEELPALVWSANMAALELHVPQWRVGKGPVRLPPDRLVFDLDPGPFTELTVSWLSEVEDRLARACRINDSRDE